MRRPMLAAALALAALAPLAAAPLAAQAPADSGARVRVRVALPRIAGTFHVLAATPDSLVLQRDPGSPVHRVAVASIERLDVSRGPRSAGAGFGRGLLIGGLIGAGVGIATGLASGSDDPGGFLAMDAEAKALGGGLVLGVGGGLVGGLIGALAPGERWQRVEPGRVAVVAPPGGRGVGLRLAGAF